MSSDLLSLVNAECQLMCLAGRVDFSADAAAGATRLVREGRIDWHSFLARVERNYVAPLVYRNLKSIGDAGIASKVLDTLRVRSKLTAFKSEQFTAELVRLSRLFESHGIRTLHYKGAVTAQEFYGSVTLRNFNDLDFLVRREDLRAMVRILEEEGYRNSELLSADQFNHYVREFKEFLFTRGEVQLEPHWSLAGRRYRFDPDFEGFWDRSRPLRIRDTELRAMSMEDSLLVLCLVGAKGRWKRLQMITDIAACAARLTQSDWTKVERRAAATGTLRILLLGLLLASELSGAALPTDLEYRAQTDSVIRRLAREVTLTVMNGRKQSRFLPDTPAIFSKLLFLQREKYRDRWTYLWHTTTTPDLFHLRRIPLPKVAHPLYRLLVPLHDFVMYPAWRAGQTVLRRTRG